MKKFFSSSALRSIKTYAVGHKIIASAVTVIICIGGYYSYAALTTKAAASSYILGTVTKGTLISSVTGSGQVSASNQIDIKAKVSGLVTSVPALAGTEVRAGSLIAQLDSSDAQKSLRDAQISYDSAKIALEKLKRPADNLSLIQSQNALTQATQSKQKAEDNLVKAYDDGFTDISNAYLNLPTVMLGLQDILYKTTGGQDNISYYSDLIKNTSDDKINAYKKDAADSYATARAAYDKGFADYKAATRYSDTATIEKLISETYNTTKSLAEAVKNADNLFSYIKDTLTAQTLPIPAQINIFQTSLASHTNTVNTNLVSLLNAQSTIKNTKDDITNSELDIQEKTESLAQLKAGTEDLDLQSSELSLQQRANALADAREKFADYSIRAPFDATVAKINIKKLDDVTSGTAIATLITKQKVAEITLNEVDIAKIKVGQKVTLTFDAVDGLSISGAVSEIDSIGTVSQGVVTYAVKITFDTDDDRVKPGMSVSASIVTDVKQDVLTVPSSAVKSSNNATYIETLVGLTTPVAGTQEVTSANAPTQVSVTIGESNDTLTEIISGLAEGDAIITRTITGSTVTKATTQTPSLFGGGTRAVGGTTRVGR